MKQSIIFFMILTLSGHLSVFAATLQNTDSQEYEIQMKEEGLLILTLFYLQSLTQYNPSGLPGVEGNAGQLSRGQVKQAVS